MDPLALLTALVVAGAIVTGVLAAYYSTAAPRSNLQRRLGALLVESVGFEATATDYQALRPKRAGRVPIISALLEGRNSTEAMALRLEQADLKLTVSEFVAIRVFAALVGATIPILLLGGGLLGLLVLALGGLFGYMIPRIYVSFARGRRVNKLNQQLVEALSLISNSLKAGFGLMQSLDLASRELRHPISTELRRLLYDVNVGSSTEDALQSFVRRSGSEDLDIVVTAMLIQQSTGGNLAEILDSVGHTMRERIRIRGEIKTLTTQQMLTGFIVGGLPIVMMGLFYVLNPGYLTPLFTETAGNIMLIIGGFMELFGLMVIKKILAIEV